MSWEPAILSWGPLGARWPRRQSSSSPSRPKLVAWGIDRSCLSVLTSCLQVVRGAGLTRGGWPSIGWLCRGSMVGFCLPRSPPSAISQSCYSVLELSAGTRHSFSSLLGSRWGDSWRPRGASLTNWSAKWPSWREWCTDRKTKREGRPQHWSGLHCRVGLQTESWHRRLLCWRRCPGPRA